MYSFPSRRTCPFSRAAGQCAGGQQIFAAHHFRADEASLDVGVNRAGGFLGVHAAADGPGAHFRLAGGEKGDEPEEFVGRANQAMQAGLFQSVSGEQFPGGGVFEFCEFGFDASTDGYDGALRPAR